MATTVERKRNRMFSARFDGLLIETVLYKTSLEFTEPVLILTCLKISLLSVSFYNLC